MTSHGTIITRCTRISDRYGDPFDIVARTMTRLTFAVVILAIMSVAPLRAAPPDVFREQSEDSSATAMTPFRPTRTVSLTTLQLATLGLKATGDALRYVEDGVTITVRTNGISAIGERLADDLRTPRHITLYRNGVGFARWMDGTAVDTDVNTLIGIQVTLRDPSLPMFPEAEVILWYAPTREVIDVLPDSVRRRILQELEPSSSPSEYVERRTSSPSIASMTVAPNPVHASTATVHVNVRSACRAMVRMVDMMGREADVRLDDEYSFNVGTELIALTELDNMPSGMYNVVIDIPASNERIVHRLLIER